MKVFRIVLGIAVILFAVWLIVTEQLAGASADATINAQLVTVRAPIAGTVELTERAVGARLNAGQTVGVVSDNRADRVRLDDLEMELDLARAGLAASEARIVALRETLDALALRGEAYGAARIVELEVRLAAAEERLAMVTAGPAAAAGTDEGAGDLAPGAADDLAGIADTDLRASYAREQVEILRNALEAARRGTYLGDGYNDAPFADQRRTEIEAQIAAERIASREAEDRIDALVTRVEDEQLRVNGLNRANQRVPAPGPLFEVLATSGEVVERGDPVLTTIDCNSLFVTLSVTEIVYNRLMAGGDAMFRPQGSDKVFEATITRLAGAGAARVYGDLAVAPSEQHLERFDVTLLVPGLRSDPELACAVGRTGRAYFDQRPLDGVRYWLANIGD